MNLKFQLPSTFQALVKGFRLIAFGEPETLNAIILNESSLAGYRMLTLPEFEEFQRKHFPSTEENRHE